MKELVWNKGSIAKNYELGRPLDEIIVKKIFTIISDCEKIDFNNKKLLDAGCGTGRISAPIAEQFENLEITGIDKSDEMLAILTEKIRSKKIGNYNKILGDLLNIKFDDNHFDISLISSVLHATPDWKKVVDEILRVTKKDGMIISISEQADFYDIATERLKPDSTKLDELLWSKYINYRKKHGLESPLSSEVGIKWTLVNKELAEYLKRLNFAKGIKELTIDWKHNFTIGDFMFMIENRCWSSMFTANEQKYKKVVTDMKKWISEKKISLDTLCPTTIKISCEIIYLKK